MQPDKETRVLFVDLYAVVAGISYPHKPADWAEFCDMEKYGDLEIVPRPGVSEILERAERAGYEIAFLSERPERYTITVKRWLANYNLLYRVPIKGVKLCEADSWRQIVLKPPTANQVNDDLWKASMIASIQADEVVYVGGVETGQALEKIMASVEVFRDLAECERVLFAPALW